MSDLVSFEVQNLVLRIVCLVEVKTGYFGADVNKYSCDYCEYFGFEFLENCIKFFDSVCIFKEDKSTCYACAFSVFRS